MRHPAWNRSNGTRLALAALLLLVLLPGYAQETETAKKIGKRLMCMCGCNQVLTACNHVGCTVSSQMLKKLDQRVTRNEPEDLTIQSFVQEYGESVMAEPPAKGFNLTAWLIPGFSMAIGMLIVCLIIVHWRRRKAVLPTGPPISKEQLERARQLADRETED